MATYFVALAGSNTAPYDTWAKAATSIQTALTAASSGTDVVVVKYDDQFAYTATTTLTTANHVTVLSASNDGGSAFTPTAMGETGWIGSANGSIVTFSGGADDRVLLRGITFRMAGTTAGTLNIGPSTNDGADLRLEDCKIWFEGTGGHGVVFGLPPVQCLRCEFKASAAAQQFRLHGSTGNEVVDCTFTGTSLNNVITGGVRGSVVLRGCDLSTQSGNLVANIAGSVFVHFDRCRLHASVTPLAAQTTNPTNDSAKVLITDSHSGDTHGYFAYYDSFGSVVLDTSVYTTTGAAQASWRITTTANASFTHPFRTPWIDWYNTGTSTVTPRLEVVRTGSSTAYTDAEVWSEWLVKTQSGFTQAKQSDDRQSFAAWVAGAAASNQATGDFSAADWTGEGATAWFGKLAPSSLTPAEVGALSARVCVGLPSISGTLYVDPQIRT